MVAKWNTFLTRLIFPSDFMLSSTFSINRMPSQQEVITFSFSFDLFRDPTNFMQMFLNTEVDIKRAHLLKLAENWIDCVHAHQSRDSFNGDNCTKHASGITFHDSVVVIANRDV